MHFSVASALFLAAAAGSAIAQTPQGFQPEVKDKLTVTYGDRNVDPPGVGLDQQLVATPPNISVGENSGLNGTFMFIMMDLDVPTRDGNNVTGRQTLLHCMAVGFTLSPNGTLTSQDRPPAPYQPPSPPPEQPPKPHRYVELLYPQPDNFQVPDNQKQAVQQRRGFDLNAFSQAAALQPPARANYFTVVNNSTDGALQGPGPADPTQSPAPAPSGKKSSAGKTIPENVGDALSGVLAVAAAVVLL